MSEFSKCQHLCGVFHTTFASPLATIAELFTESRPDMYVLRS